MYRQLQNLVLLVNLVPVNAIAGPLQDTGELVISRQPLNLGASGASTVARHSRAGWIRRKPFSYTRLNYSRFR